MMNWGKPNGKRCGWKEGKGIIKNKKSKGTAIESRKKYKEMKLTKGVQEESDFPACRKMLGFRQIPRNREGKQRREKKDGQGRRERKKDGQGRRERRKTAKAERASGDG